MLSLPISEGAADALFLRLLEAVDTNRVSRAIGRLAETRLPPAVLAALVRRFAAFYGANLDEAERPPDEYGSFDEWFTRRLRPGARAVAAARPFVTPCDGTLLEAGFCAGGRVLHAKGRSYSLAGLVGSDAEAERLAGGPHWTIYLAPRNYHRVHAPCDAVVDGFVHLPGPLYPVNDFGVRAVEGLFERNERVATLLRDARGRRAALVMVGAFDVGSIELCYDAFRANRAGATGEVRRYRSGGEPRLRAGDELGVFHLGSTVILLAEASFASDASGAPPVVAPGTPVRMGEALGLPAAGKGA